MTSEIAAPIALAPIGADEADDTRQANLSALQDGRRKAAHSVVVSPNTKHGIDKVFESYAKLGNNLPFEVLAYVEQISRYNPDFSQAVENLKTLANSGHELFVKASTDLAERKAKSYLEEQSRKINPSHGGIDGLIDKLLWQAATFGAMCGEWVLSDDLTEVIDFADINPKSVRFFWDVDAEYHGWAPYQEVKSEQALEAEKAGQKVRLKRFVRLNPITFHYYAFDPSPNSPYGTPPFLAALRNIGIQDDMVDNMSQIVKKMGLLGIVDMSIKQLQKRRGESDTEFVARATSFLESYAEAAEQMVTDGGLVHFDDAEVSTTSITGNAAGATNIFKQNEEQIFSGLKSMPSVQGRSYSTTETYAGVAYDIIIRNTWKYQRAVKRMIEAGYWLMLDLKGLRANSVKLNFNPNKTLHRLQNSQAQIMEIKAALMLWAIGIFDQRDAAQYLGYSDVKTQMDEIPESQVLGNSSPGGGAGTNSTEGGQPPTSSDNSAKAEYLREILEEIDPELAEVVRSILQEEHPDFPSV